MLETVFVTLALIFTAVVGAGILFMAYSINREDGHGKSKSILLIPLFLLALALAALAEEDDIIHECTGF